MNMRDFKPCAMLPRVIGHGCTSELLSQYREIRALRIYEGASDVQKIVIARSLLSSATGR